MMSYKRILSFLLAMVMLFGMMPTASASETETTAETTTPATTESIAPQSGDGEGEDDPCEVCDVVNCGKTHEYCDLCEIYDCGKTHVQCAACGEWDCENKHEYCNICEDYDCGIDHTVPCLTCGVNGCTTNHVKCEECDKYDCGIEHSETDPTETTAPAETTAPTEAPTEPEETIETTEDETVIKEISLSDSVDGKSFEVSGESIPEGAEFVVSVVEDDLNDALAGLGITGENISFFDISIEYEGEKWQPGGIAMFAMLDDAPVASNVVTLSVEGMDVSEGDEVIVYHLFDSANAIANAYSMGDAYELDVSGHEDLFEAELEAAEMVGADEGVIYYEIIEATVGSDGTVTFETSSFSRYVLATGNTTKGAQASIDHLIMKNGVINYYYVMPNTTLTLYSSSTTQDDDYDIHLGSSASWTIDSSHNELGLSAKSGSTYVVKIPANASTSGYTAIKANGGTARIYVRSKQYVVNQALKSDEGNGNKVYEVYLTCITDPQNGLPGEPGVNTRKFNIVRSDFSVHKASGNTGKIAISAGVPSNIIDSSIATEAQFVTSTDGTCTLGLVDPSGIMTKSYIKLTTSQWNTILKNLASTQGTNGWIYATDGERLTSKNYSNYVIIPYVVKLQTVSGFSWNIDCYVVPKANAVSLSYNFNLPSGLYTDKAVPATKTGYNSFSAKISNVLGTAGATVTLKDKDNGEYKYRFLGWGLTTTSGRNIAYDPNNTVTITKNTMLYAQWAPLYKYVLNFNANGGTGAPSTITKDWDTPNTYQFTWTAEPTRSGYKFLGWSTDGNNNTVEIPAGTKKLSVPGIKGQTKTTTIYAVWDQLVTINYAVGAGKGSVTPTSESVAKTTGNASGSTATPAAGYQFDGWYTDAACTQNKVAEAKFVPARPASGWVNGTTYYAKFTPISYPYTIKYLDIDTNTEIADTISGTAPFDSTLTGEQKTIENYTFVKVEPSALITIAATGNEIIFYYRENSVTINYEVKGPAGSGTVDLNDGATNPVDKTSETLKVTSDNAKGATAAAGNGYEFVGWYDDEACAGDPISSDASYIPEPVDGKNVAATYYAKFEEVEATITYVALQLDGKDVGTVNLNGDTDTAARTDSETFGVVTGDPVGATATPDSKTYKFVGWYDNKDCEGAPVSIDASFDPASAPTGIPQVTTYYAKFEYNLTNMTITKNVNGTPYDADDTFIFEVTEKSTGEVIANITLKDGGCITIKDVTVGETYVVREKQNSNRYNAVQPTIEVTIVPDANENRAEFSNNIGETKWLTATSVEKNVFGN